MSSGPASKGPVKRRLSLLLRLNLWYGAIVTLAVVLALLSAELTASYLARQRQVELVHRVQTQVEQRYVEGGPDAASRVEVSGAWTELRDEQGNLLGHVRPWPEQPVIETMTQLDEGVWLRTGVAADTLQTFRRDARLGLVGGGLVALIMALGGGMLVTRRSLRPIDQVVGTAQRIIAAGDSGQRVPPTGTHDQLAQLVALFNELLDRNAGLVQGMRQSLDNVGHDLRTPLTRIRTAAEVAVDSQDTAQQVEALEVCMEEATAAHGLLTTLLDITQAEAGMLRLDRQSVSLRELAQRTAALYQHVADEGQVELMVTEDPDVVVSGDPMRLQQAAANVVDNALKFSAPGSRVQISVRRGDQGQGGLQVQDHGSGIAESDLPHLFDRLFRGDASRSTSGAGLGLAMVKAIIDAHDGRVEVQSVPGQGTTLTLWLPTEGV